MKEWKYYAKLVKSKYPPYRLEQDKLGADKKSIKKAKKFRKKWGFGYDETWNLDMEISKFIFPRILFGSLGLSLSCIKKGQYYT